jgi:CRP/FNR family transcriptional regulator
MKIYESNAQLKDRFVRALAPALLDSFDLMASMLSGHVEQRMAVSLCRVSELLAGNDYSEPLPITRQNLADIASTTVESAIRVTSRWQKEGWIATKPRELRILDPEALRRIVRS